MSCFGLLTPDKEVPDLHKHIFMEHLWEGSINAAIIRQASVEASRSCSVVF